MDLAMCRDEQCPSRNQCKRYVGKSCVFQCFADFGRSTKAVRCCNFILQRGKEHDDK